MKKKVARAYFRGGDALRSIESNLDRQLGKGTFGALAGSTEKEEYNVAREILRHGVLR